VWMSIRMFIFLRRVVIPALSKTSSTLYLRVLAFLATSSALKGLKLTQIEKPCAYLDLMWVAVPKH